MMEQEVSSFRHNPETAHNGSRIDLDEWFEPEVRRFSASEWNDQLSRWSQSGTKRALEVSVILLCLPVLIPLLAGISLLVRVTSGSPVIFRQSRVGRRGTLFTIFKFRTMVPPGFGTCVEISAGCLERVTSVGAILRRTKLDELPQLWNVLRGDMSLVGPRPKVPEQQGEALLCRPGITGAATLAFATEEVTLARVPGESLNDYFTSTVLPAKRKLDDEYMRRATACSDLLLITDTVLGRWRSYGIPLDNLKDNAAVRSLKTQANAKNLPC